MFRLLLAVCPEALQLFISGRCKALPHLSPPKWLGLHISRTHLPLPALPGGTLYRFVVTMRLCFLAWTYQRQLQKDDIKMLPISPGVADGLCCRLTEPCFIQGFDNAREAMPMPTNIRRPTINWKDISRCGRLSANVSLLSLLRIATRCHSVTCSKAEHQHLVASWSENNWQIPSLWAYYFQLLSTLSESCWFNSTVICDSVLS